MNIYITCQKKVFNGDCTSKKSLNDLNFFQDNEETYQDYVKFPVSLCLSHHHRSWATYKEQAHKHQAQMLGMALANFPALLN